jgi:hypothetical protein
MNFVLGGAPIVLVDLALEIVDLVVCLDQLGRRIVVVVGRDKLVLRKKHAHRQPITRPAAYAAIQFSAAVARDGRVRFQFSQ